MCCLGGTAPRVCSLRLRAGKDQDDQARSSRRLSSHQPQTRRPRATRRPSELSRTRRAASRRPRRTFGHRQCRICACPHAPSYGLTSTATSLPYKPSRGLHRAPVPTRACKDRSCARECTSCGEQGHFPDHPNRADIALISVVGSVATGNVVRLNTDAEPVSSLVFRPASPGHSPGPPRACLGCLSDTRITDARTLHRQRE